jgi:hypothetical protein
MNATMILSLLLRPFRTFGLLCRCLTRQPNSESTLRPPQAIRFLSESKTRNETRSSCVPEDLRIHPAYLSLCASQTNVKTSPLCPTEVQRHRIALTATTIRGIYKQYVRRSHMMQWALEYHGKRQQGAQPQSIYSRRQPCLGSQAPALQGVK